MSSGTCSNDFHRQKKGLLRNLCCGRHSSLILAAGQTTVLKMAYETEPRGSMYGIFTYIYHKNQPNVGKYTSPMDPLGNEDEYFMNVQKHWQRETNPGFGTMMIDFQTSSTTSIHNKCKLRTTHPWSSPQIRSYMRFRVQNPKLQPNIFVEERPSPLSSIHSTSSCRQKTGKVWTSLELDLAYHWMIQKSGKISLDTASSCDPFVFYSEDSLTKTKSSVPCMTFLFTAFCSMFVSSYDILLREIWQLLHCAKFFGDPMRGGLWVYKYIYTCAQ